MILLVKRKVYHYPFKDHSFHPFIKSMYIHGRILYNAPCFDDGNKSMNMRYKYKYLLPTNDSI
ncbi:hypothetical protein HanHA300_Chr16g0596551 [Helianthus annuus]|nr:hypothetical protein HanHA300_Chr16g0596551 [Helianthus annuus]KAJ0459275.1 hypothetical protein HanHA89_Chr16g0647041 [Helianthus annuus]